MKNPYDNIGESNRELPACSAMPPINNLTMEKSYAFTALVAIFLVEPTVICLLAEPRNMWNKKNNNGMINTG
jgi:hypothetical protein